MLGYTTCWLSYEISFHPTKQYCNTDGLSRLPVKDPSPVGNPPDPNICQVDAPPVTASELQIATHADPILGKLLTYVKGDGLIALIPVFNHTIRNSVLKEIVFSEEQQE